MKHLPTTVLLDLADDVNEFAKRYHGSDTSSVAPKLRLAEIDTELLSRMPEVSYITVLDDSGNPVGFEPYIGEDNEYLSYLATERRLYEQAHWVSNYFTNEDSP